MDLPASSKQQYPTTRWLGLIVLLMLAQSTWTQEFTEEPDSTVLQGPCRSKIPCKAGVKQGDPGDCAVYYECSPDRSELSQEKCPPGTNFDRKQRACSSEQSAKCTRPCKVKADEPPPPSVKPDMESASTPAPSPAEPLIPDAGGDEDTTAEPELPELPEQPAPDKPQPGVDNTININDDKGNIRPASKNGTADSRDRTTVAVIEEQTTAKPEVTPAPAIPEEKTTTTATTIPPPVETTEKERQSTTEEKKMAETTEGRRETTQGVPVAPETPAPPTPTPEPPYVIVTDVPEATTQGNNTAIGPGDLSGGGLSTATIGIIAGVVGGVVLLALIIIIIILVIRKRRRKKNSKIIRMENPEYTRSHPAREQNFRFSRDSTLYVGPTVNLKNNFNGLTVMNNNSPDSERKKRLAPPPPGSTGSGSPNSTLGRSKRQAPPPPNPFTGRTEDDDDLYEKDSNASSIELTTFTAKNTHATVPEEREPESEEEELSAPTEPLVRKENGVAPLEHVPSSSSSSEDDEQEEEEEELESPPANSGPQQSLLSNKYSKSQASINSYDIEKNPFFED